MPSPVAFGSTLCFKKRAKPTAIAGEPRARDGAFSRIGCVLLVEDATVELRETLLSTLRPFFPFVENHALGLFFTCASDQPEEIETLWSAVHAVSSSARLGVARTKTLARFAAQTASERPLILSDDEEQDFLSQLSVDLLEASAETLRTLHLWGILTCGALIRLPPKKLVSLLGQEGWRLYQRALGRDLSPLLPTPEAVVFKERITLEWSVSLLEPCVSLLEVALERLSQQLGEAGLACQAVEVHLQLDPTGEEKRLLQLRAPTNDVKTLVRLVRLHIMATPPRAPINGIAIRAYPAEPVQAQLSLFGPTTLSPSKTSTTLAEFQTLLGPGRVGSPQVTDDHAPERWAMQPYTPGPAPLLKSRPTDLRAFLAIRVVRPAIAVSVRLRDQLPASVADHCSVWKIDGLVRKASGPWPLEAQWWTASAFSREYWDVLLSDGALYRIYQDVRTRRWYLDGMYD